jgi:Caspase domain
VARDDPFGCRATVRAQMGIAPHAGYAYPEFGPRVRKCMQAHLGGGSRQETAQRTAAPQPAQEQAKQANSEEHSTSRNSASNRFRRDVAYAPSKSPLASQDQSRTPNGPVDLGKRVALVIGNGAYQHVPALANPPRDSADVAEVLSRLGFSVTLANDLSLEQTKDAVTQFGKVAIDSDIALVFYAGHGIEAYGENWMIPVDARVRDDGDMRSEAINLKTLSSEVAKSKSLGLIILDACRDNPFTPAKAQAVAATTSEIVAETERTFRSVKKGLAPTEPSGNVLIGFAAKDGTTASDGDGKNSPFTSSLLRHIETPGLEVSFLFRRVRDDVMSATNGLQQPYVYGSLSRTEIFLKPASATGAASPIR